MSKVPLYSLLLLWSLSAVSSVDICEDQKDGARLAHPVDCSRFIECGAGATQAIRYCPFGLHFNRYESFCDLKFRAGCDFSYALQMVNSYGGDRFDCEACRSKCSEGGYGGSLGGSMIHLRPQYNNRPGEDHLGYGFRPLDHSRPQHNNRPGEEPLGYGYRPLDHSRPQHNNRPGQLPHLGIEGLLGDSLRPLGHMKPHLGIEGLLGDSLGPFGHMKPQHAKRPGKESRPLDNLRPQHSQRPEEQPHGEIKDLLHNGFKPIDHPRPQHSEKPDKHHHNEIGGSMGNDNSHFGGHLKPQHSEKPDKNHHSEIGGSMGNDNSHFGGHLKPQHTYRPEREPHGENKDKLDHVDKPIDQSKPPNSDRPGLLGEENRPMDNSKPHFSNRPEKESHDATNGPLNDDNTPSDHLKPQDVNSDKPGLSVEKNPPYNSDRSKNESNDKMSDSMSDVNTSQDHLESQHSNSDTPKDENLSEDNFIPTAPTPSDSGLSAPTASPATDGNEEQPIAGPSGAACANSGKCLGQKDGALFADPSSNGFIVCQCQCEVKMACPQNLIFSEAIQACDWPQ